MTLSQSHFHILVTYFKQYNTQLIFESMEEFVVFPLVLEKVSDGAHVLGEETAKRALFRLVTVLFACISQLGL